MAISDDERVHPETVEEWRAWLQEHHATSKGVWLVSWKKDTGRPFVAYEDAITEALAVGWIDSQGGHLDENRRMLRFSPRRPRSPWARTNKERVARLVAEGRMQPAGQAAVDVAKANGYWSILDDVEDLVVPDDLAAELDRHPGARASWDAFAPSARRMMLWWIVQARRPETRRARIAETAEKAGRGERARQ
jgi:uncharacterized protein YdeI (YjbR/CyaY-like superfamily)